MEFVDLSHDMTKCLFMAKYGICEYINFCVLCIFTSKGSESN